MSQHDMDVSTADANTGATVRAAINAALQALVSNNSGATAPTSPYPFMFWADTANDLLKIRNAANTAWISVGKLSLVNLGLLLLSAYTANSILAATSASTPLAVTINEQTILGRITGGNIAALSASQVKTLLAIADSDITLSDITTNDVSTGRHGFVPKAPNDTAKFLRGDGTWSTGSVPDGARGEITVSASGAAWSINNGVVSQAKLKTASGAASFTPSNTSAVTYSVLTLPGGEYGFYPRICVSDPVGRDYEDDISIFHRPSTGSYLGSVSLGCYITMGCRGDANVTQYAYQRYVTSSGEVNWLFVLRNKTTKNIISSWLSTDHPCFGNGGSPDAIQHPFPLYDSNTEEIICVIISNAELDKISTDAANGRSCLQVINEDYEIDNEGNSEWPAIPVTVGLPEGYDWQMAKSGDEVTPIKKIIPHPDYITCKALKLKK